MTHIKSTTVLALTVIAIALPVLATSHLNVTQGMMIEGAPLALRGYDPVAYFTVNRPVKGSHTHTAVHEGAVYQFSSAANKKTFEANPSKYVPSYGGFCAFGVSVGKKFDGDPTVWKIVDGRLYLNLNSDIQKTWEKDVSGNIKKASLAWTRIENVPAADLK